MIRVVRMGTRFGAALVALGLMMMGPAAPVGAAEGDQTAEAPRQVAQIKIEIKLESGRVIKPEDNFTVEFGVDNSLEIQAEGSSHLFSVKVDKKGSKKDSKDVSVTVGYNRDGEAVIAPYTFDTKVKKREVVRVEGGLAIALTVTPKKAEGDKPPEDEEVVPEEKQKPRDKIEISEDEDDPLGGLD